MTTKSSKPNTKPARYGATPAPRKPGALKGKIKISLDFDKLPSDIAGAFDAKDS